MWLGRGLARRVCTGGAVSELRDDIGGGAYATGVALKPERVLAVVSDQVAGGVRGDGGVCVRETGADLKGCGGGFMAGGTGEDLVAGEGDCNGSHDVEKEEEVGRS